MNAHSLQLLQVGGHGAGRIVGEERISDAGLLEVIEKAYRVRKYILPEINGTVHIQGDVFDSGEFCPHFRSQFLVVILFHIRFHLFAALRLFAKI